MSGPMTTCAQVESICTDWQMASRTAEPIGSPKEAGSRKHPVALGIMSSARIILTAGQAQPGNTLDLALGDAIEESNWRGSKM